MPEAGTRDPPAGDADEVSADPVFPVAVGGTGEDALLIFDDRFGHLDGCGGGSVVSAAGLEELDDLGAAIAGALDDFLEAVFLDELRYGDAAREGVAEEGDHVVAMPAQEQGLDVFDAAPD